MKIGALVRTRIQQSTTFEFYAGERTTITMFTDQSTNSSCGKFESHQVGIILEDSNIEVKILVPDSGLIGWVNKRFIEVME